MFDFQISGVLDWVESAISTLLDQCITNLGTDPGQWVNGGPPDDVINKLCHNDCNGNGACQAGEFNDHKQFSPLPLVPTISMTIDSYIGYN